MFRRLAQYLFVSISLFLLLSSVSFAASDTHSSLQVHINIDGNGYMFVDEHISLASGLNDFVRTLPLKVTNTNGNKQQIAVGGVRVTDISGKVIPFDIKPTPGLTDRRVMIHNLPQGEAVIHYKVVFADTTAAPLDWRFYDATKHLQPDLKVDATFSLRDAQASPDMDSQILTEGNGSQLLRYVPPTSTLHTINTSKIITDLYFKDFVANYTLQKDSSLLVEEAITADAANIPNKHGIFRVLPTQYLDSKRQPVETPISLISITDFAGNPYQYETMVDWINNTLTWKIGDADRTITGIHEYKIVYRVENVIQQNDSVHDVWRWNLSGAFWDLNIEHFSALIHLPAGVNQNNVTLEKGLTRESAPIPPSWETALTQQWQGPQTIAVQYADSLSSGVGIQLILQTPKGIFQPYQMPFFQRYQSYIFGGLPIVTFLIAFYLWFTRCRAPRRALVVEYGPPENLSPAEVGMIWSHIGWKSSFYSANIMQLVVKGYIAITTIQERTSLNPARFRIESKVDKKKWAKMLAHEQALLLALFNASSTAQVSITVDAEGVTALPSGSVSSDDLKLNLGGLLGPVQQQLSASLLENRYISRSRNVLRVLFFVIAFILIVFAPFTVLSWRLFLTLGLGLLESALVLILWIPFMEQVTPESSAMRQRVRGFRQFMVDVEQHRQVFFEKEGLFVELLPYAMIFGMTKIWLSKLKTIFPDIDEKTWSNTRVGNLMQTTAVLGSISAIGDSVSRAIGRSMSSSSSSSSGGGFSSSSGGGGGGRGKLVGC